MRGNTGHVSNRVRTVADRTAEMTHFLYFCSEGALANVSVDQLVVRHKLDRKACEYALGLARQKRTSNQEKRHG